MKIDDFRVLESNPQWSSVESFCEEDKHLRDLNASKYQHDFRLEDEVNSEGVYLLFGGRQIGKTTALKQLLQKVLLRGEVLASQTLYLNCDFLVERDELERVLRDFYSNIDRTKNSFIVIDEVSNLKDWQYTIKAIIDLGWTNKSTMILTGSDRILLEDGAKGFPGINRRGASGRDIELYPLCFKEYVGLVTPSILGEQEEHYKELVTLFKTYLLVGGYLSAINIYAEDPERISSAHSVYKQWIVSDFLRKGKEKSKLYDVLRVLVERYSSQASYTKLAQESLGISTETVINYLGHLERLGILIVLQAFDQNKRGGFPKKDRRFHFTDPFIANTIVALLKEEKILASDFILPESGLVESLVVARYSRKASTYYIKAEGEIDLVVLEDKGFLPIEIKWTENLKKTELKQILKYPNGVILNKNIEIGLFEGVECRNLILDLLR